MPNHHALLSASSSDRWIHCPPSVRLEEKYKDTESSYALEGTNAHELCEYLLHKALGDHTIRDPTEDLDYYDQEMQESAEGYRDAVMEIYEDMKKKGMDPAVFIEQQVDFSRYVPEGFGTSDCLLIGDDTMVVVDFKYGKGVEVHAEHNSQLSCYALGAYLTFSSLYDIQNIMILIYQPRIGNYSKWELTTKELLTWAEEVLKPAATLAFDGKGKYCAGNWCRFCKAKATCRARAKANLELAKYDFADPPELDDSEISAILPQLDNLLAWGADVKDYALQKALAGTHFDGYKLVEGKSNRRYTDEDAVAAKVLSAGYDPYEKKLLGITAMTRELGKKTFNDLLSGLIEKPQGKPTLVPESDKRPALNTAKDDFSDEKEN
jgi:hypothetical protein